MKYWDNLIINDENIALAYHIDRNLIFKDDNAIYALGSNEYTCKLAVDFITRRENLDFNLIKFDLLELHSSGFLGKVILDKNILLTTNLLEFLRKMMELSLDSWSSLNRAITVLYRRYRIDRNFHSVAMQIPELKLGFTICISTSDLKETKFNLHKIVKHRKYNTKSDVWYAVILNANEEFESVSIF